MSTATDGTLTQSWSSSQGFLMHTDTTETCLTYTYAWGSPTSISATPSYPSATTSSCLSAGWSTDISPNIYSMSTTYIDALNVTKTYFFSQDANVGLLFENEIVLGSSIGNTDWCRRIGSVTKAITTTNLGSSFSYRVYDTLQSYNFDDFTISDANCEDIIWTYKVLVYKYTDLVNALPAGFPLAKVDTTVTPNQRYMEIYTTVN